MQEQALRMSRLVNDLLSLSRIEQRAHQTPSEPVDLTLVIDETLDVLRQRATELDVALTFAHPVEPSVIAGDRDELLRLADNLVENAVRYGRSGGRVDVTLSEEGERIRLDIRDYGPGIPPEHLPRLTERFYRVDAGKSRESGGTGLGLALVKHIAQRHQARLSIANAEGGGARVTVSFRRM
jgi:two-component system phosphate regulon sensor histidine kinase PhoR